MHAEILSDIHAHLIRHFREAERIGRRRHEKGRAEIFHKHDLLLAVARRGRHDGRADILQAVMQSERAGEHTVSETDLRHIVRRGAAHRRDTRDAFRPHIEVVLGITHHGRLTRRTGGSVHAHEFLLRNGEKTEGVIVAEVGFRGKRQFREVFQGLDVIGLDADGIHLLAIRKHLLVHAVYGLLQTFELDGFDLASR